MIFLTLILLGLLLEAFANRALIALYHNEGDRRLNMRVWHFALPAGYALFSMAYLGVLLVNPVSVIGAFCLHVTLRLTYYSYVLNKLRHKSISHDGNNKTDTIKDVYALLMLILSAALYMYMRYFIKTTPQWADRTIHSIIETLKIII